MSGFQMLIGSTPKGKDLNQDLHLIKVGILYADRVTLCSPGASMYESINVVKNLPNTEKIKMMLPYVFSLKPELQQYEEEIGLYFRLAESNRNQRRMIEKSLGTKQFKDIRKQGEDIHQTMEQMLNEAGFSEMEKAFNSGKVELKEFTYQIMDERMLTEYVDFLFDAVKFGRQYPLFDDLSSEMIASLIKENSIEEDNFDKGNQVKLAQDLFERLPLFSKASIDEIIDIRSELDRPLRKFRSGMIEFTEDVKNGWWDKDFIHDAEKIFYKKVEPAVIEIEEQVESVSFLKELIGNKNPYKFSGGTLMGQLVDGVAATTNLSATAFMAGLTGITTLGDAYLKKREKEKVIKENRLYFYYKLKSNLT